MNTSIKPHPELERGGPDGSGSEGYSCKLVRKGGGGGGVCGVAYTESQARKK